MLAINLMVVLGAFSIASFVALIADIVSYIKTTPGEARPYELLCPLVNWLLWSATTFTIAAPLSGKYWWGLLATAVSMSVVAFLVRMDYIEIRDKIKKEKGEEGDYDDLVDMGRNILSGSNFLPDERDLPDSKR